MAFKYVILHLALLNFLHCTGYLFPSVSRIFLNSESVLPLLEHVCECKVLGDIEVGLCVHHISRVWVLMKPQKLESFLLAQGSRSYV